MHSVVTFTLNRLHLDLTQAIDTSLNLGHRIRGRKTCRIAKYTWCKYVIGGVYSELSNISGSDRCCIKIWLLGYQGTRQMCWQILHRVQIWGKLGVNLSISAVIKTHYFNVLHFLMQIQFFPVGQEERERDEVEDRQGWDDDDVGGVNKRRQEVEGEWMSVLCSLFVYDIMLILFSTDMILYWSVWDEMCLKMEFSSCFSLVWQTEQNIVSLTGYWQIHSSDLPWFCSRYFCHNGPLPS